MDFAGGDMLHFAGGCRGSLWVCVCACVFALLLLLLLLLLFDFNVGSIAGAISLQGQISSNNSLMGVYILMGLRGKPMA